MLSRIAGRRRSLGEIAQTLTEIHVAVGSAPITFKSIVTRHLLTRLLSSVS